MASLRLGLPRAAGDGRPADRFPSA